MARPVAGRLTGAGRWWFAGPLALGAAAAVAGMFLPWLRSGSVQRNSFTAGNALRRVEELPRGVGWLFDVWPYVPLVCALAVAAAMLGRTGVAAVAGGLAAAVAGSVAGGVLARSGDSLIAPELVGPIVTVAGSGAILATVLIAIVVVRPGPRR